MYSAGRTRILGMGGKQEDESSDVLVDEVGVGRNNGMR
jgi:hypothetical protein